MAWSCPWKALEKWSGLTPVLLPPTCDTVRFSYLYVRITWLLLRDIISLNMFVLLEGLEQCLAQGVNSLKAFSIPTSGSSLDVREQPMMQECSFHMMYGWWPITLDVRFILRVSIGSSHRVLSSYSMYGLWLITQKLCNSVC